MNRGLPVLRCATCAPLVWKRRYAPDADGWPGGADWIVVCEDRLLGVMVRDVNLNDGKFTIGHRSLSGDRPWRATNFDEHGAVGHSSRATLAEALFARVYPHDQMVVVQLEIKP